MKYGIHIYFILLSYNFIFLFIEQEVIGWFSKSLCIKNCFSLCLKQNKTKQTKTTSQIVPSLYNPFHLLPQNLLFSLLVSKDCLFIILCLCRVILIIIVLLLYSSRIFLTVRPLVPVLFIFVLHNNALYITVSQYICWNKHMDFTLNKPQI